MRCDDAQELITGLVDGELTPTERAAVEGHLAECYDCAAQFQRETALKRAMKIAASAIVVPQALREKIEPQRQTPSAHARDERNLHSGVVGRAAPSASLWFCAGGSNRRRAVVAVAVE